MREECIHHRECSDVINSMLTFETNDVDKSIHVYSAGDGAGGGFVNGFRDLRLELTGTEIAKRTGAT
jgi:hypothetical protein